VLFVFDVVNKELNISTILKIFYTRQREGDVPGRTHTTLSSVYM
jgi:hypothetical protein